MAQFSKKSDRTWLTRISLILLVVLFWSSSPRIAEGSPTETRAASIQPYLDRVLDKVTEFTLDNGMKFIILENHQAPVVSFVTYANVGGVNEPDGKTGVAHFLEHLAFKGNKQIGTTNYSQEKPLLDKLDQISTQIRTASATGNKEELQRLQQEFIETENEAQKYVKQNEYGQIVETAGAVGVNAATSSDSTQYFYSFPSNKLELWMSLESERFLHPVFREFYKEQQVILEERRMRNDNSPIGKMVEAFLDTAFTAHPYKRPVIGYDRDIRNLTRKDVEEFFSTYYGPNNLTIAIVGDVAPQQAKQLAQIYFGRYQPKAAPPQVTKVEPKQLLPREVTLKLPSQPWYLEGYHIPQLNDPDYVVYEMISGIISDGRTSRLYKSLVEEKQIALVAEGYSGFPGDKYPSLMLFYAMTSPNHTVEEVAIALREEIERLKNEPVMEEELNRVKTQARADLLRALDSNMGMAKLLAEYQAKTGNWRNLFEELDAIAAVTPADIQRVARSSFNDQNRTVGKLLSSE
jgi:predicted Zn-dependent peptidase